MRAVTPAQARAVTEQVLEAVVTPALLTNGRLMNPTLSAGLVLTGSHAQQAGVLIRADIAMYAAKYAGKSSYQEYHPERHGLANRHPAGDHPTGDHGRTCSPASLPPPAFLPGTGEA